MDCDLKVQKVKASGAFVTVKVVTDIALSVSAPES